MQGTAIQQQHSWRPFGRLVLIACAALALFLQSYAVQTHFHERSEASVQTLNQTANQTGKHHAPATDDSDNCPLCHSFYSGQYVAPSLASWFLPLLAVSVIDTATGVSPHYDTVSHSWRGRGPPHI
jgi:hypothetical protein